MNKRRTLPRSERRLSQPVVVLAEQESTSKRRTLPRSERRLFQPQEARSLPVWRTRRLEKCWPVNLKQPKSQKARARLVVEHSLVGVKRHRKAKVELVE